MRFTCEYKYDGFRGQIHYWTPEGKTEPQIEIYSRNLEYMTVAYPDVIGFIKEWAPALESKVTNFILDCELVAYDTENDKILPF